MEDGINSGMHMPESICNDRYHPTKEEDNTLKNVPFLCFVSLGTQRNENKIASSFS